MTEFGDGGFQSGLVAQHVEADVEHPADVLVVATGFHVTDAFEWVHVTGKDGKLFVNGRSVVKTNIPASNGLVQELNGVLR